MAARSTVSSTRVIVLAGLAAAVYLSALLGGAASQESSSAPEPDRLAKHEAMMRQMQGDASPEMIQRMNSEEWRWLRALAHLDDLEEHMRVVDRTGVATTGR